jgi:hypothetical protein
MILRLTIALSLLNIFAHAQSQQKKDSLVNEICKTIGETTGDDTLRVQTAFEQHLYPFLRQYSEEEGQKIATNIELRLQRNCKIFSEILLRLDPPHGDWQAVSEKPKTKLIKKTCHDFPNHRIHKYLESNGDTVNVTLKDGYWIEDFKNGTFSKLKFIWTNDCEFELEFIESNNAFRKNFSKPGDRYRYEIIDKNNTYYNMSAEIVGASNVYMLFKIYY